MQFVSLNMYNIADSRNPRTMSEQILNSTEPFTGLLTSLNFEKIVSGYQPSDNEYFIIDGIGASLFGLMHKNMLKRNPGVDLFHELLHLTAMREIPVFFLGASPEVNIKVQQKFASLGGISDCQNGYNFTIDDVFRNLCRISPAIVFVALGSPRQELVSKELYQRYPHALYIGVGGSFDIYAGVIRRCPKILRIIGLEWLYRIIIQPFRLKRLLKNIFSRP
jgi:exopolysaccharide biosynthesis WecB/TagA/CpsF family protein